MKVLALALVLALAASPVFCQTPAGAAAVANGTVSPPPPTNTTTAPPPPSNTTAPPPPSNTTAPPPPSNTTAPPPPSNTTAPPPMMAPPPTNATPPAAAPPQGPGPVRAPPPPGTPAAPPTPGATPAATPPAPAGIAGATPAAAGVSTGGPSTTGGSSGPSEADILTFAYNLECLEGQFYSCAASGQPLSPDITGNGPPPSSCKKANLTNNTQAYASEFAREETAHVAFLFNALKTAGASPVCPSVNIDTAFEAAAEAAYNSTTPLDPLFDPYANDAFFLHGAFIFEDLGASAYVGGVAGLTTAAYRAAATQIGNTESYHAGIIRTLLYSLINETPAYQNTVSQITGNIVSLENKLAGPPQLHYNILNSNGTSLANVDSQAFVPSATTKQVLQTVTFGAQPGSGGGFFPNNLNGAIKN